MAELNNKGASIASSKGNIRKEYVGAGGFSSYGYAKKC